MDERVKELTDEELKAALLAEGRTACAECAIAKARDFDDDDPRLASRFFHLCGAELGGMHGETFVCVED